MYPVLNLMHMLNFLDTFSMGVTTKEALKNKIATNKNTNVDLPMLLKTLFPKPIQHICLQGSCVCLSALKQRNQ